jgi:hypothetical protein
MRCNHADDMPALIRLTDKVGNLASLPLEASLVGLDTCANPSGSYR